MSHPFDTLMDYDKLLDADLGGYSLSGLREAGGEETLRFEAYITRNGKKVLHVSNGGEGGCHRYDSAAPPMECGDPREEKFRKEYRAEMELLKDFASKWAESVDSVVTAGQEDTFVNHLTLCIMFSRRRSVPFIMDDMNPFKPSDGSYRVGPPKMSHEQLVLALKDSNLGANPRVWDKKTNRFERV